MSMTVTIDIDGPREPEYVLELAEAFAEAVRALNHLTMSRESIVYPNQADHLIRCLSSAASRLPQLLEQGIRLARGRARTRPHRDPVWQARRRPDCRCDRCPGMAC